MNNTEFAIAAYQKYLLLDPDRQERSNVDFAKQQLKALGAPETAAGLVDHHSDVARLAVGRDRST